MAGLKSRTCCHGDQYCLCVLLSTMSWIGGPCLWISLSISCPHLLTACVCCWMEQDFFAANASAHASRRSSPRVHNRDVQEAVSTFKRKLIVYKSWKSLFLIKLFCMQSAALKTSDHRRATPVGTCLEEQLKHLNLPILPTTTIGSFPQTAELFAGM